MNINVNIQKIYEKYNIMPSLQLHLYRVAAVASMICDNWKGNEKIYKDEIITACLLHDIGNIIKFDLSFKPELLEPEGLEYWQKVKDEFMQKYGNEEHEATYKIAEEIGIGKRSIEILKGIGFMKTVINYKGKDYSKKIAAYSDSRAGIEGILSIEERIRTARERFIANKGSSCSDEVFERNIVLIKKMEKQIFDRCKIAPTYINNISISKIVPQLLNFNII